MTNQPHKTTDKVADKAHDTIDHAAESAGKAEQKAREGAAEADTGGIFTDLVILLTLIGTSIRDTARLLGLETRLVVNSVLMMLILGLGLGFVVLGIWLSITLVVVIGFYEFTPLGMTLSIAVGSLVNVACAGVLLLVLKKLAKRLAFPETRLAVRTLLEKASQPRQP